jgi:hypothetical protein
MAKTWDEIRAFRYSTVAPRAGQTTFGLSRLTALPCSGSIPRRSTLRRRSESHHRVCLSRLSRAISSCSGFIWPWPGKACCGSSANIFIQSRNCDGSPEHRTRLDP